MEDKLHPENNITETNESTEPITAEYKLPVESHFAPKEPKSRKKLYTIVAITLVLLTIVAVYWFVLRGESTSETAKTNQQNNSNSQIAEDFKTTPTATDTKKYTSAVEGLNLSFDYPSNWQVVVLSDTNKTTLQYIQVSTTNFSLMNAEGQQVTGKVIITMRTKGSEIPELTSGDATIAQDSQQIGYKKPSANQRQYPYISFVHLTNNQFSNNPFEQVIITGGKQYKKNEVITSAKVKDVDPLISFTLYRCKSDTCTDKDMITLSITDEIWKNNQNLQQVKALLESLVIN